MILPFGADISLHIRCVTMHTYIQRNSIPQSIAKKAVKEDSLVNLLDICVHVTCLVLIHYNCDSLFWTSKHLFFSLIFILDLGTLGKMYFEFRKPQRRISVGHWK